MAGETRVSPLVMLWLRGITGAASVVVAGIALVQSYAHMHDVAFDAGEQWRAHLFPVSVDGVVVAASMVLLTQQLITLAGGRVPFAHRCYAAGVLGLSIVVSLAANIADAWDRTDLARALAAWPAVAFAAVFELLLIQWRAHALNRIEAPASPVEPESPVEVAVPAAVAPSLSAPLSVRAPKPPVMPPTAPVLPPWVDHTPSVTSSPREVTVEGPVEVPVDPPAVRLPVDVYIGSLEQRGSVAASSPSPAVEELVEPTDDGQASDHEVDLVALVREIRAGAPSVGRRAIVHQLNEAGHQFTDYQVRLALRELVGATAQSSNGSTSGEGDVVTAGQGR